MPAPTSIALSRVSLPGSGESRPRLTPLASALAVLLMAGGLAGTAQAAGGAWFAQSGAGKTHAASGVSRAQQGLPSSRSTAEQQAQSRQQLQRSLDNVNRTVSAIAAQQAAQAAARDAASDVPDGLVKGGLWDKDAAGNALAWSGAERAQQTGNTVNIKQTASRAILNWDTFNVGRNTTVQFQQQSTDAVLNRVVGADAKPSQIQGAIKADGTVMVVNRNGVVFGPNSQVDTRNLVAAAASITDDQFLSGGLYRDSGPTFTDALGAIRVERGAAIGTATPSSATDGGGYVLLLGAEVANAGAITTPKGQTVLAAGDHFTIRRGQSTDGNAASTTRGNEVTPVFVADSLAGAVENSGLITAATGDVTLAGRNVTQRGALLSSTSVDARGTIHLKAAGAGASVTLAEGATSAILIDANGGAALDSQRAGLLAPAVATFNSDAYAAGDDIRYQPRVEVTSAGTVEFQNDSMTLATGGQIVVSAAQRTLVRDGARLDVAGALGVQVAMASNTISVNIQGNEQRDASVNRDGAKLNNSDVWVDVRDLVFVPAGTGGYASDRWYTAGGLLEVGGYLGTRNRTVGEWLAPGGTVRFGGDGDLVTQSGSQINLSGGTLDVQSGYVNLSWLRGTDNRLYEVSRAPGDLLYQGMYLGYEDTHERWGHTTYYRSPLIAPERRYEQGYTVGRDAGTLVVDVAHAVLEGELVGDTYQGPRQDQAAQIDVDGFLQVQRAVARGAQLVVGSYEAYYLKNSGRLQYALGAGDIQNVVLGGNASAIADALDLTAALPQERQNQVYLDTGLLNRFKLGAIRIGAADGIQVDGALEAALGGEIVLYGNTVTVNADLTARAGTIRVGNVLKQIGENSIVEDRAVTAGVAPGTVTIGQDVMLDASGLWGNLRLARQEGRAALPYLNGGTVAVRGMGDVTLSAGSVVDVSSGGAILANGKLRGGKGGNVSLMADTGGLGDAGGLLTLDGWIRGYGVSGGGTLQLESGSSIAIGGELLQTAGVLGAGEAAPVDLVTLQDITLQAGTVLPIDTAFTVDVVLPGVAMPAASLRASVAEPLVLAADWQPPRPGSSGGNYGFFLANGGSVSVQVTGDIPVIPAGTAITGFFGSIGQGMQSYVPSADVFPNGIPIQASPVVYRAGAVAPQAVTYASGTRLPAGVQLGQAVQVQSPMALDSTVLQTGFAAYDINGHLGVGVARGARVAAVMPVYRPTAGAQLAGSAAQALEVWTPPVYLEDPAAGVLTQRQGADLTLRAERLRVGGGLSVGQGAVLGVDPGATLSLLGGTGTSVNIEGTLQAWGGTIRIGIDELPLGPDTLSAWHQRAIHVGGNAVIDVAARAQVRQDVQGNWYGVVPDGGSIQIGGEQDWADTGEAQAPQVAIVVDRGALLDASGASGALTMSGNTAVAASAGGSIVLKSAYSLYLDGTMRAASGGAQAEGGVLAVALETPLLANLPAAENRIRTPREFILSQAYRDSSPGDEPLRYGVASLSVDQVRAGGFDSLSLLADGILSFDGDVALDMRRSLELYAGAYALSDSASDASRIALSAPYVRLAAPTRAAGATGSNNEILPTVTAKAGDPTRLSAAVMSISADMIDVRDRVAFGVSGTLRQAGPDLLVDRRGFERVDISSRGDLRLLGGSSLNGLGGDFTTELASAGDLFLTAAQIYPATGVVARIRAGGALSIARAEGATPDVPWSVLGRLTLSADEILQGGIVRAPMGSLTIGVQSTKRIELLPGSIASVSGAGLLMPYGGTVDGQSYLYAGNEVREALDTRKGEGALGISLMAGSIVGDAGSTLDVSGGGTLTGAGFVTGRGGSVDVLSTPLASVSPAYAYSDAGNAVYAIVPTATARYAPLAAEAGAGDPAIGQQITLAQGVPGLPAGTYTLLPSTYALLPGAFRVELGGAALGSSRQVALRDGSYAASGTLGYAATDIKAGIPTQVLLTPADTVRKLATYNETGLNSYLREASTRLGGLRGWVSDDATTLTLNYTQVIRQEGLPMLAFDGIARFAAVANTDGRSGTLAVAGSKIDIYGGSIEPAYVDEGTETSVPKTAVIAADALNAFHAPRLMVGGTLAMNSGDTYAEISGTGAVRLRSGATLAGTEVFVVGNAITVEQGAVIDTRGRGLPDYDSDSGVTYATDGSNPTSVLVVSNGRINVLAPASSGNTVTIGNCLDTSCTGATAFYTDGTLALATGGSLALADSVRYGAKHLVLSASSINLGGTQALADAAAAGALPSGLTMNQSVLDRLLAGNAGENIAALQSLTLNARESVNVYGALSLDTTSASGSLGSLMLGTPAIYGYGQAGDVASIRTGEFIWAGAVASRVNAVDLPAYTGAAMADRLGTGTLDIFAQRIVLGDLPTSRPDDTLQAERISLGFSALNLNASERFSVGGNGVLQVFRQQGEYVAGQGYTRTGGALNIVTPLLTGQSGAVGAITAGGSIALSRSGGMAAAQAVSDLGARLSLTGQSVSMDTTVALPSGRLTVSAEGGVSLGSQSLIDMAGRETVLIDVSQYSWGGDVTLTSTNGAVTQAAGSLIDLHAINNRAGTLAVTALGDGGQVSLDGDFLGAASGQYATGGSVVPYANGQITVRANTLADFTGLNTRLNAAQMTGARSFQIRQGDLVVGDEVRASEVSISVDNGSLTVNGRIDASGWEVGSIRLAAGRDLVVNGTLDAHGTGLRVDSYGKIIDSPNRAIVDLTSRDGTLTLATGAAIDLRAGTGVDVGAGAGLNDGVARGTLDLNVRRVGTNDAAIQVGTPSIQGASLIAVNAFRTYGDADMTQATAPDVSGTRPYLIDQAFFDTKADRDNTDYMNAALANTALASRLSGLGSYHLRPGVEVSVSGNLTLTGDLDLSNYRYGPDANRTNAALRGYGEPGVLVLRAGGDLTLNGSINDGFAPPSSADNVRADDGWILTQGNIVDNVPEPTVFGNGVVVPIDGVQLETGTIFPEGSTLNYDLPAQGAELPNGTVLPVDMTLAGAMTLPAGTVLAGTIYAANGSVAYPAGTVLSQSLTLSSGMKVGAGTTVRGLTEFAPFTWPRNVPLPVALKADGRLTLARGSLIPSMTRLLLPDGEPINLRPDAGEHQGANWAVAPMLGAGASSWDLRLAAGADLEAADTRATRPGKGALVLGDAHVMSVKAGGGTGLVWGPDGAAWWGFELGSPVPQELLDAGWCDGSDALCVVDPARISYVYGPAGPEQGGVPGEPVDQWLIDAEYCSWYVDLCVEKINPVKLVLTPMSPLFSVVRTGAADLDLVAGGDIRMESAFGVYTAGRPSAALTNAAGENPYNLARAAQAAGQNSSQYQGTLDAWQAWYPEQGGNLMVQAGGDLVGDIWGNTSQKNTHSASSAVGNWLWRQGTGSTEGVEDIATAWWINFGAYARPRAATNNDLPVVVGFTGLGTLGGGDVSISVEGDAGMLTRRGDDRGETQPRSQGLVVAVGSTGRVTDDGQLVLTGGGDLSLRIAGSLNPALAAAQLNEYNNTQNSDLNGVITNLRGLTAVQAGAVGGVQLAYRSGVNVSLGNAADFMETRTVDPYVATLANSQAGITLIPGDSAMHVDTLGDLVLNTAADAGRVSTANLSSLQVNGTSYATGQSWFSLWTPNTALHLFAAGGNMTPNASPTDIRTTVEGTNLNRADGVIVYPSILEATAATGSVYLGYSTTSTINRASALPGLLLAPSSQGSLSLLAGGSIYAGGYSLGRSGADTALPTPLDPAFAVFAGSDVVTNASLQGPLENSGMPLRAAQDAMPLFAFGADTAGEVNVNGGVTRVYARDGDIIGLNVGTVKTYAATTGRVPLTWYRSAGVLSMQAGRDIVQSNVVAINGDATDVARVAAGRDLIYSTLTVAGPGLLEVSAGRHVLMQDKASITSLGPVVAGDTRPGAGITVLAGMGTNGPDYAGFIDRYIDPANQAVTGVALADQPGKVVTYYGGELTLAQWLAREFGYDEARDGDAQAYLRMQQAVADARYQQATASGESASRRDLSREYTQEGQSHLVNWLQTRFGTANGEGVVFDAATMDARAFFDALPAAQRNVYARQVYFAELKAGGREYNDADGVRYGSYLRGRNAIAALFPEQAASGDAVRYDGDIIMYGGSGVHTAFGGDIQMLTPGGRQVLGIEGVSPPSTAGVVTQGQGDIQLYSLGSILLGQSRIMTTFGGSIQAWSATGDINAGRGSKTTVVYTPPKRVYDDAGNVTLSVDVPSTGAGIATLAPIPDVPPGDVDLIAPLGTIDAGEAGIRVSGNVNIAALTVVNAANIQVQGESKGIPVTAVVNTGALSNASAAATSAASAAQDAVARTRAAAQQALPSIISVQVLGFGDGSAAGGSAPAGQRREPVSSRQSGALQVVGAGELSPAQLARLSPAERERLGL
ncbi:filamentous haemagglutinin family protein [Bordetella ansorpii]